jgi:hypothetical protein
MGATKEETISLNAVIESEEDRQQFSVFVSDEDCSIGVKTTRENLPKKECESVIEHVREIIADSSAPEKKFHQEL